MKDLEKEQGIKAASIEISCTHCGDICEKGHPVRDDLHFCCNGCSQIHLLLSENGLGTYYSLNESPGASQRISIPKSLDYLDDEKIISKLIDFKDQNYTRVKFELPAIHCSSCIWLLENLNKLDPGIVSVKVDFMRKQATILFMHDITSMKMLVHLLHKIGYEPLLSFAEIDEVKKEKNSRALLYKIGLSGFAFGNIMLLSFPEYLGFEQASFKFYIGYINIFLALPVLLYAGWYYIDSAIKNLRYGKLGINVPLAIGMITLFSRSVYEILSHTGEGYLDSFAGFVFFLLIGRWFQDRTYKSISFDRSYKSYFPIAILKSIGDRWATVSIDKLKEGNEILVKNQEVIPCDAELIRGHARIDYSFVTGESKVQSIKTGGKIFAGGIHHGASIELKVLKSVDQSYLTQLWNEKVFHEKSESRTSLLLNGISKYFTFSILIIAAVTFIYWFTIDKSIAYNSFTAVLIVACPCALALSIPFMMGNAMRIMSNQNFYVKNTSVLEKLLDIDFVIFDKTGTITDTNKIETKYEGKVWDSLERNLIYSLSNQSNHPLSRSIAASILGAQELPLDSFNEYSGQGISGSWKKHKIRIGSANFILGSDESDSQLSSLIEIDGMIIGHFHFTHQLRTNIKKIILDLQTQKKLAVLTGDTEREKDMLGDIFPGGTTFRFKQKPKDKLDFIKDLQKKGNKVMMIGDGLNDAGALKQSDVGIVLTDNNNSFSPACDAIILAERFPYINRFFRYVSNLRMALYGAFLLAFLYNVIGLYFAVTGQLSPVIAAILMPTSSISVIFYGLLASNGLSRMNLKPLFRPIKN